MGVPGDSPRLFFARHQPLEAKGRDAVFSFGSELPLSGLQLTGADVIRQFSPARRPRLRAPLPSTFPAGFQRGRGESRPLPGYLLEGVGDVMKSVAVPGVGVTPSVWRRRGIK